MHVRDEIGPKKYIAIWQLARRGHNPFYAPAIKSGSKNAISLLSIKQGWFLETGECFFFNEVEGNNSGGDVLVEEARVLNECIDPRGVASLSVRVQF